MTASYVLSILGAFLAGGFLGFFLRHNAEPDPTEQASAFQKGVLHGREQEAREVHAKRSEASKRAALTVKAKKHTA